MEGLLQKAFLKRFCGVGEAMENETYFKFNCYNQNKAWWWN